MGKTKNRKRIGEKTSETPLRQPLSRRTPFFEKTPVLAVCLFLLAALAFSCVLNNDFLTYDDFTYVTGNDHVQHGLEWSSFKWAFATWWAANWHPLTWLSHMLDCQLFGLRPWGHHLTNLLLHAINTSLVFCVLRKMTGAIWPSVFVAGLFGIHPLHVESVAWVAERKDVLSTLFWMLSLWAYAGFVEESKTRGPKSKWYYALSLVFLALGLMSKPMLVTAPFLMLLLDYWPLRRWERKTIIPLLLEKVPFLLLAVISAALTFLAQKNGNATATVEGVPLELRVENTTVSYALYLCKLLWPVHLAVIYPYPDHLSVAEVLPAALLIASIWIAVFIQRRARPFLFVGWAWFFGTLVPVIGLVQVGPQSMADRYMYVPSIGIFIAATWGIAEWSKTFGHRTFVLAVGALVTLAVYCGMTIHQIGYWKNTETLFQHAIAVTHNNGVAYANLADYESDQGRLNQAIGFYQEAAKLQPQYPLIYDSMGVAFLKEGRINEAISQFEKASQMDPTLPRVHEHWGLALKESGQLDDAITQDEAAVRLSPDDADAHADLGLVFQKEGRITDALAQYQIALKLDPNMAITHYNLALAQEANGNLSEAGRELEQCLKLNPDFPEAHNELGTLLGSQGRLDQAISEFREAIRLKPDYTDAQRNLSMALELKRNSPPGTNAAPGNTLP